MNKWLIIFMLICSPVFAVPTQTDTDNANAEFDTRDTYQSSYYTSNSDYEQKLPETKDGIKYETHIYNGPLGKGHVHIAEMTQDGKLYRFERHTGSENRKLFTSWAEQEPIE